MERDTETPPEAYPYPENFPYPPPGGHAGGDDAAPTGNEGATGDELTDTETEVVEDGGPVDDSAPSDDEPDLTAESAAETRQVDETDEATLDAGPDAGDPVEAAAVEIADEQDEAEEAGPQREEVSEDALPGGPAADSEDHAVGVAAVDSPAADSDADQSHVDRPEVDSSATDDAFSPAGDSVAAEERAAAVQAGLPVPEQVSGDGLYHSSTVGDEAGSEPEGDREAAEDRPVDGGSAWEHAPLAAAAGAAVLAGDRTRTATDERTDETTDRAFDETPDRDRVTDEAIREGDEVAAAPATVDEATPDAGLLPGAVSETPATVRWGDDIVSGFRDQWREVQLAFVDDPQDATGRAQNLLVSVIQSLTQSLNEQKDALDQWRSEHGDDTEKLRIALQHYREFLDRMLAL